MSSKRANCLVAIAVLLLLAITLARAAEATADETETVPDMHPYENGVLDSEDFISKRDDVLGFEELISTVDDLTAKDIHAPQDVPRYEIIGEPLPEMHGIDDDSPLFADPRTMPPPEPSEEFMKLKEMLEAIQPEQHCHTPFGQILGTFDGVPAYSNCHESHVSMEDHMFTTHVPGLPSAVTVNTGMKWQCVEFARRFLLVKHGVVFTDVMGAVDIWRLTNVHWFNDPTQRFHLGRYRNDDDADRLPVVGSLVVWPIQKDMPFGHVAVIGEVIEEPPATREGKDEFAPVTAARRVATIRVGEQNYHSIEWKGKTFARELHVETKDGEYFAIVDPAGYRTLGWMTYEKDIKPLDQLLHFDVDPGMPAAVFAEHAVGQFKPTDADEKKTNKEEL
jgi:hypothetical protein